MRVISGFTLIELLITVGIMAVMAAGVASMLGQGSQQYARDGRRQADLEQIRSSLELYRSANRTYPAGEGVPSGSAAPLNVLVSGGFGSQIPVDPKSDRRYYYSARPDACTGAAGSFCTGYRLCANWEKTGPGVPSGQFCTAGGSNDICAAAAATWTCDYLVREP